MKRTLPILFSIFIFLLNLSHTTAQKSGYVVASDTKEYLVGAYISQGDLGTTTDTNGFFTLSNDVDTDVTITYLGYETKVLSFQALVDDSVILLDPATTLMQTTTVTASRYEKGLAESTISLEVIKPDFIESTNTNSIDNLLERIPGVQLLDGSASIRGGTGFSFGAGSRVMVLVDDLPLLQGDSGKANWSDLPIENIAQIEVLKGAGSALYGSAAMNGVINIKTARPGLKPKTKAFISFTAYQDPDDIRKKWWEEAPIALNVGAVHLRKIGNLDLSTSFNYIDDDDFNQGEFTKRWRLTTQLDYRLNDKVKLGLGLNYNDSESANFFLWKDAGAGAYQATSGTISSGERDRFNIDPTITYYGENDLTHKLLSRYYRINNKNNLNQANKSNSYYLEYQAQKRWSDADAIITGGVVYNHLNSNSELFSDTSIIYDNTAAYIQLEKKFLDKLSVAGGVRYERYDVDVPSNIFGEPISEESKQDDQFISRLGLNYSVAKTTFLRASYGQSYRFPTIAERYIATGFSNFTIFPNVSLEPESGFTSELGIKQGISWKGIDGYIDIAGFWQQYDNMLEFSFKQEGGLSGFQSQNVGNTMITGAEINLFAKADIWKFPIKIFGGYTYIDPKYRDFDTNEPVRSTLTTDQNVLKYRTKHLFKIDAETDFKGISFGLTVEKTSNMINIDQILANVASIRTYRELNGEGYMFFNLRLAYKYSNYKLSTFLNNVSNIEYTRRPGYLEAPRNFAVRLDVEF